MVSYDIWFNLKNTAKDLEFCEALNAYLDTLADKGAVGGHTLRRRMLGLGPSHLGEFNVTLEFESLAQLEQAFLLAASRGPDVEPLHAAVYSRVKDLTFGLSRTYPDSVRVP